LIFLRLRSARLLSSKIDISFYNWKIMHINNAYLRCFRSNFLRSSIRILCCSSICILCRSSYIEKLYYLSNNLSICFASNFRFKAFDYKQISALSSITLLRCIIMNIFVLSFLFYLVSYIVFHRCFVDLIRFFSNIELF